MRRWRPRPDEDGTDRFATAGGRWPGPGAGDGDPGLPSWDAARDSVLPLLARRMPPATLTRTVAVTLDPGLRVGFGVDLGPMFLHVTNEIAAGWQVDVGELTRRAIANLRRRSERLRSHATTSGRVGMTRLAALQSPEGWASSLLLAPDLLGRWFGSGPRVLIAPSRNMLVALPPTTDARLARWLRDGIAMHLPDALDVPPLRWDEGRLALFVSRGSAPRAIPRVVWRGMSEPRWRAGQGPATTWYRPPPDRSVT